MDDLICEKCGVNFPFYKMKNRPLPRFCSHKCRGHTGFRPGAALLICEMTDEQKFDRLKKSFEKHVIRQEGCWSWNGPITKGGYPVMSCRPEIGPTQGHRASWVIHGGKLEKSKHICHACDNPICTNPEHLWLGTHKENNDDKIAKGRANWVQPPTKKGSENGSSKLNEDQVKEIKILISQGHACYRIGKKFNVSATTIKRIRNGSNWKHVEVNNDEKYITI